MSHYIGLYYPSVGFNNDAWVKLAVLYWDKLGRIVPHGYEIHDSDTVLQLTEELGFIQNFAPSEKDINDLGKLFFEMLYRYSKNLVNLYGLDSHSKSSDTSASVVLGQIPLPRFSNALWAPFDTSFDKGNVENTDLGHTSIIAAGKIHDFLIEALVEEGLARHLEGPSVSLVEMHPNLAYIYMAALAEQMASSLQFHPVTDNVLDHIGISWLSTERLAQALLFPFLALPEERAKAALTTAIIEEQVATIALQSVLPRDIASIPTKKIIKLRTQHLDEMTAFQTYLHDLVTNLEMLQDLSNPTALKAHLETEYEKKLKPQLNELNKCFKALGIDTMMGAINVRVVIPAFLASAGSILHLPPINPIIIGSGAIAFSVFPVLQRKQAEIKRTIRSSPAAYLLYAQEVLKPASLLSQVMQGTRKLLYRA